MRDLVFQSVSTPTLAKDYFFKKVKKHDKLTWTFWMFIPVLSDIIWHKSKLKRVYIEFWMADVSWRLEKDMSILRGVVVSQENNIYQKHVKTPQSRNLYNTVSASKLLIQCGHTHPLFELLWRRFAFLLSRRRCKWTEAWNTNCNDGIY